MMEKSRAWAELHLANLEHNIKQLKSLIPAGCKMMPAVKADAYGHGVDELVPTFIRCGIRDFCVACIQEGIALRQAGASGEILILGYTHPDRFSQLEQYRLTQTVVDLEYAQQLRRFGRKLRVHVGIDTGMHRLGICWQEAEKLCGLMSQPGLLVTGIFSHLCVPDSRAEEDMAFTLEQIRHFDQVTEELECGGFHGFARHLQGSYGMLNYPGLSYDYCRPGIIVYGLFSKGDDWVKSRVDLRPVLELKTRVQSVRKVPESEGVGYGLVFRAGENTSIAALSIGYADGVPREIAGKGYVLIRGQRVPIIGRLCMDQMLVDVSDIREAAQGDEAVLIGSSGQERISGELFADWCGTITNEVFSRLGGRLERIVV